MTTDRLTPAEVITANAGRNGEYVLAALTDAGYAVTPEDEGAWWTDMNHRINELEDQRDRAVRALAGSWPVDGAIAKEAWELLDEDWAQAVLDD